MFSDASVSENNAFKASDCSAMLFTSKNSCPLKPDLQSITYDTGS